jgi:ribosomal protein S18 acetylase RimI-like enzyme
MDYHIRDAKPKDMAQVLGLIKELALFEKEPQAVEVTTDDLIRDGFGKNPMFHCFVAEANENIIGIALVYSRYSTWKGHAIHLEDLIVSEAFRGHGLGSALLEAVIKYGHSQGVRRICWEVLDWNEPAIDFYESKGANILRDWDVVHMNEQAIKNYIENI